MAGATISSAPEAVKAKVSSPAAPALAPVSAPGAPALTPEVKPEEKKSAAPAASSTSGVDRAGIARVVEQVLAAQGIARGSGAPKSLPAAPLASAAKEPASASSIASEIANRFFGSSAKPKVGIADASSMAFSGAAKTEEAAAPSANPTDAGKTREPAAKTAIEIQVFVSENDVRRAMTRSEKIFIGRKTILTPSARDLGLEHEVFVETEAGSIR
jgi:hypothetical protein